MKITGDCPHCKKDVEIDIDKLEVTQPKPIENASTTAQQTQQIVKPEIPEPKIEIKTVAPSDEPFYQCKNGECGKGVHKNPNYSKAPNKKCKNCDSLNGKKACKNCGNTDEEEFDELSAEELEDLKIPLPEIHEHEHEV